MLAADLSLIPARASTLDLEAARPTRATLARLNRPYAFVLNACPAGRSSRIADASRALSLLGVLAPVMVQRMEHVDEIALAYDRKRHDLYIETINLMLRSYGKRTVADIAPARDDVGTCQRGNVADLINEGLDVVLTRRNYNSTIGLTHGRPRRASQLLAIVQSDESTKRAEGFHGGGNTDSGHDARMLPAPLPYSKVQRSLVR